MAIKLSQGLLSSLGAAGGTPQDTRQPMGSGLLQPALSSNPLVNTLVRSIGQARGMDMRTPSEIATQAMSQIGQDDPERLRKIVEIQLQAAVRAGDTTNAAKYANVLENIKAQEVTRANLATPKAGLSSSELFVQRGDDGKNYYYRSTPTATGGAVSEQITPVGGHNRAFDPDKPVSAVGGQFLETAMENLDRVVTEAGEKEEVTGWKGQQLAFSQELPKVQSSLKGVRAMIEVLKGIETGGVAAGAYQAVAEFFNIADPQALGAAKLRRMAQGEVLKQLKATVGGNPSDGERKALDALITDINTAKEVNLDTLLRTEDSLVNSQQRLIYGLGAESFDDYKEYIIKGGAYDSLFDPEEQPAPLATPTTPSGRAIIGGRSGAASSFNQLPSPDAVDGLQASDSQYFSK
ncbi:MAG: hypothetical protein VW715_06370 [Rhodospirillales bacterium]